LAQAKIKETTIQYTTEQFYSSRDLITTSLSTAISDAFASDFNEMITL